jgi:hypothetical protein
LSDAGREGTDRCFNRLLLLSEATLIDGQKKSELGRIWLPVMALFIVLGLGALVVLTGFDPANHTARAAAMALVGLVAAAAYVLTGIKVGLLNPRSGRRSRPTPTGGSQ